MQEGRKVEIQKRRKLERRKVEKEKSKKNTKVKM